MASKVFADANILLDLTLKRAGYDESIQLFQLSIDGTVQLYTTPAVLHIVSYYTGQAYPKEATKKILLALLNDIRIVEASHATVLQALNSSFDDLEDAMQYFAAMQAGLHYFVSADKKLKKSALHELPVCNLRELFTLVAPAK